MQDDLTGERLAQELKGLLGRERNEEVRAKLKEAAARLGEGGASRRAAREILSFLGQEKRA
jgi:hypothetical protein